jgi:hypothetical protein
MGSTSEFFQSILEPGGGMRGIHADAPTLIKWKKTSHLIRRMRTKRSFAHLPRG